MAANSHLAHGCQDRESVGCRRHRESDFALHPRSIRAPFSGPSRTIGDNPNEKVLTKNPRNIRVFRGFWWSVVGCAIGAEERT